MKKEKIDIMMQLNVVNYNEKLVSFLLSETQKIICIFFPHIKVIFERCETYWKIPEMTECFLGIRSDNNDVRVDEIKDAFGVKWEYVSTPCYDIDDPEKKTYENESAIWDKRFHGGTLLHENVEWAHIYTWEK